MAYSRFDRNVPNASEGLVTMTDNTNTHINAHKITGSKPSIYTSPVMPEQPHRDFILWLNGAVDLLDSTPPSQAQWDMIRARTAEHVSAIVYKQIQDLAAPEHVLKSDAASGWKQSQRTGQWSVDEMEKAGLAHIPYTPNKIKSP